MNHTPDSEGYYRKRIERVQAGLAERGFDALLDLSAADINYLTGFFYAPTERPTAILVPREGEPVLLLPLLDIDQSAAECWVQDVQTYFEYPGPEHPITWMGKLLAGRGLGRAAVGIDEGAVSVAHARMLRQALPAATFADAGRIVSGLRLVKDEREIAFLRKAHIYADMMQEIGLQALRERQVRTEFELTNVVNAAIAERLAADLSDAEVVNLHGMAGIAVVSGPKTAYPHGRTGQRELRAGEPVMLSLGCTVGGYHAENTRTYLLGQPDPRAAELYRIEEETQGFGRGLVGPGRRCGDISVETLSKVREMGAGDYIRHRTGHGLGLEGHEPPWLDEGDSTTLVPNMVVTVEPGIWDPETGGFLISDTLLVTEDGADHLTVFPRSLDEITVDW
jgi:Xaa-Pro dipeptidase